MMPSLLDIPPGYTVHDVAGLEGLNLELTGSEIRAVIITKPESNASEVESRLDRPAGQQRSDRRSLLGW